ncbi:MAG: DHH family phosphoesterase [Candidatus Kerfeldbacteria bacterium]
MVDFKTHIKDVAPASVLIIHHWDADGLSCTALLLNWLAEHAPETTVQTMYPQINNYFLTESEYESIRDGGYDGIVCADLNFSVDVIEALEQIASPVFVFDHHSQTEGINRPGIQDTSYPGCSALVHEYLFGGEPSLLGVLGMVGDMEERLKERAGHYEAVEAVMEKESLSFKDIHHMTRLIDTSYIIKDEDAIAHAIEVLRKDPKDALTDEQMIANEQRIADELERESGKELERVTDKVLFLPIESEMSLISAITRTQSRKHPEAVIVTEQRRGDDASFYVRRKDAEIDLGCVAELAKGKGYVAGGKPEVTGIVLPAADLDGFRSEVFELLKQELE